MKKTIIKVLLVIIAIVFVSVILLISTSAAKAEDNLINKEKKR